MMVLHQLDHMQIICISFQRDNHASTTSLNLLVARCSSWCLANSLKTLKALLCWFDNTSFKNWMLLNKLLPYIHTLWYGINLNQQSTVRTAHMCVYVCVSVCTNVLHNTARNSSVYLPCYPPDNHHSLDVVYWRNG